MNLETRKSVIVVDENLPIGIIANTATILGMTLGKQMPELVGGDVIDKDGGMHLGIIEIPIPILMTNSEKVKELRTKLFDPSFEELMVVDFSSVAQSCKVYEDYINQMKATPQADLAYWGIAVCGDKKKINKLTGSLPLLR